MKDSLDQRLDRLTNRLEKESFQQNEGLSNEVGYYIFDYQPKDELIIRDYVTKLQKRPLAQRVNLKVFDVYEIMIKQIDNIRQIANGDPFEIIAQMEKNGGLEQVTQQINNLLQMSENNNAIVRYINERVSDQAQCVIFMMGIGKVYPILRAHKILNTMHQIIDAYPVVMFYPGNYDELSLRAFGEIKDQNYYRAFRID